MAVEKWSNRVTVVRLSDDPQFTDDLQSLQELLEKTATSTVLDFSAVRFVNSSNISHLLRLRKQAVTADLKLLLCGISTHLWGTFLTTGLDKVFEFRESIPTALASLEISKPE